MARAFLSLWVENKSLASAAECSVCVSISCRALTERQRARTKPHTDTSGGTFCEKETIKVLFM